MTGRLIRWFAAGCALTLLNIPILYLLVEFGRIPPALAMLLAGEIGLLVRFGVNDLWVFRNATPILSRLGQFHVATAISFVLWWAVGTALTRVSYAFGSR